MLPTPTPMPAAEEAAFLEALRKALNIAKPYALDLTDAQRRSMAPKAMGNASIPFAQDARLLLDSHPEVLRRTITDAVIADFPVQLHTFEQSVLAAELLNTLLDLVNTRRLASGVAVTGTSRDAYQDGQNDKGRTPGVSAIVARMGERFDQRPNPSDTEHPAS